MLSYASVQLKRRMYLAKKRKKEEAYVYVYVYMYMYVGLCVDVCVTCV